MGEPIDTAPLLEHCKSQEFEDSWHTTNNTIRNTLSNTIRDPTELIYDTIETPDLPSANLPARKYITDVIQHEMERLCVEVDRLHYPEGRQEEGLREAEGG